MTEQSEQQPGAVFRGRKTPSGLNPTEKSAADGGGRKRRFGRTAC